MAERVLPAAAAPVHRAVPPVPSWQAGAGPVHADAPLGGAPGVAGPDLAAVAGPALAAGAAVDLAPAMGAAVGGAESFRGCSRQGRDGGGGGGGKKRTEKRKRRQF